MSDIIINLCSPDTSPVTTKIQQNVRKKKASLALKDEPQKKKRKREKISNNVESSCSLRQTSSTKPAPVETINRPSASSSSRPRGSIDQLARCSIVSYDGDVVYDKYIRPPVPVTDYRTRWSGIRPHNLVRATPHAEARKEILKLLVGKLVIGHAIHNDLKILSYSHPATMTRDTSRIPLLNKKAGFSEVECVSLKRLTKALLHRDIQTGRKGHSSVEDATATMELYKLVEVEWEQLLDTKSKHQLKQLLKLKVKKKGKLRAKRQ